MPKNLSKSILRNSLRVVYILLVGFSISAYKAPTDNSKAFSLSKKMKDSVERNLLYYRLNSYDFEEQLDTNGNLILNDFSGINLLLPSGCSLKVDYKVLDTLAFNGLILVEGDHHEYRYSCENGKGHKTTSTHFSDDSKFLIGILGEDLYFISGSIFCHATADVLVSESEKKDELAQFVRYKLNLFNSGEVVLESEDDLNYYFRVSMLGKENDLIVKMSKLNFDALTIRTDDTAP